MGRINRSEEKKEEILRHLYDIISEKGIEGATLAKIAKRIGIHKSLLTYYFNTKEEMIIALVDLITEKYLRAFYDMASRIEDPKKRLEASLDIIFSRDWVEIIDFRVFYSCFYLSLTNEKIRHRFKKMYDRMKEALVGELSTYVDEGLVKIENPEEAAVFIITLLEGFDYYWAVSGYDREVEAYGRGLKDLLVKQFGATA
jgi:AcrR family transcriptional regulator